MKIPYKRHHGERPVLAIPDLVPEEKRVNLNSRRWMNGVVDVYEHNPLSEWEQLLAKAGLPLDISPTDSLVLDSIVLRTFAEKNANEKYIPEETLKAWGIVVNLGEWGDTAWERQIADAFNEARR